MLTFSFWFFLKDAFILSVDMKGFDVLAKVLGSVKGDGSREYQWKELRFAFKDEASDVETFCQRLLEMEEEALKKISSVTGIWAYKHVDANIIDLKWK